MTKSEAKKLHCTVEAAIAVIGGKYKAIIIWWLNEKGVMRYSEIQRRVPQATAKMLSQQLREMESDGIISRKVYPVVPPKTEYTLTGLGKATVPIVHAMDKWGADITPTTVLHRPATGKTSSHSRADCRDVSPCQSQREGGRLPDQTQKARHAAMWRASVAGSGRKPT